MIRAKVTSKGQVTFPKEIRKRLGLETGDEIRFEEKEGEIFIRKEVKKSPFDKWMGYFKNKRAESPDDIIEELRGR